MSTPDDLLTPAEAAALAGVQPATLKQWVRRGKIKPAKEWGEGKNTRRLFWRKDVEALVTGAALARRGGRGEGTISARYRRSSGRRTAAGIA